MMMNTDPGERIEANLGAEKTPGEFWQQQKEAQ